jgi:hypothetical protein
MCGSGGPVAPTKRGLCTPYLEWATNDSPQWTNLVMQLGFAS